MSYIISYFDNWQRGIPAIIIDCRATIPEIKNKVGVDIKFFFDQKLAEIGSNSLPYRVETEKGVLAGYFVLQVTEVLSPPQKIQQYLRPAFQGNVEISQEIDNFTSSGIWKDDYLFVNYYQWHYH